MSSFINQFKIFIKQNVIVLVRVSIVEQNEIWFSIMQKSSRLLAWKISWEAYLNVMSQGSLATSTLYSHHSPRSLLLEAGDRQRNQGFQVAVHSLAHHFNPYSVSCNLVLSPTTPSCTGFQLCCQLFCISGKSCC